MGGRPPAESSEGASGESPAPSQGHWEGRAAHAAAATGLGFEIPPGSTVGMIGAILGLDGQMAQAKTRAVGRRITVLTAEAEAANKVRIFSLTVSLSCVPPARSRPPHTPALPRTPPRIPTVPGAPSLHLTVPVVLAHALAKR